MFPKGLISDVVIGCVLTPVFILIVYFEIRKELRVKREQPEEFKKRGPYLTWGWIHVFFGMSQAPFLVLVFTSIGGSCGPIASRYISQTTGVWYYSMKFSLYMFQLVRLKFCFGDEATVLSYPNWFIYLNYLLVSGLWIFFGFIGVYTHKYNELCIPNYPDWWVPSVIGNDAFWFLYIFSLFAYKIYSLSKLVREQKPGQAREINFQLQQTLISLFIFSSISTFSTVILLIIFYFWPVTGGEISILDGLINGVCVLLMFDHNKDIRKKILTCMGFSEEKTIVYAEEELARAQEYRNVSRNKNGSKTGSKNVLPTEETEAVV